MNEPSLAHNQTGHRLRASIIVGVDLHHREHPRRPRQRPLTFDEFIDLKMRDLKFIEVAAPQGVTTGER